jgi:hypothetical protein
MGMIFDLYQEAAFFQICNDLFAGFVAIHPFVFSAVGVDFGVAYDICG